MSAKMMTSFEQHHTTPHPRTSNPPPPPPPPPRPRFHTVRLCLVCNTCVFAFLSAVWRSCWRFLSCACIEFVCFSLLTFIFHDHSAANQ